MLTALLGVTTLVCGVEWYFSRTGMLMLLWCWQERKLSPPTDEELERAAKAVARKRVQTLLRFKD